MALVNSTVITISGKQTMSTLRAKVVRIGEINKHPNADNLAICQVFGWQVIVRLDEFKEGDLAVFLPIDSIVPETPEWEFLRPRKFRVRTIRLRGVLSQGLLIPARPHWTDGMDVTEELGITKYEPPEPIYQGEGIHSPPGFIIYTDIENFQNFPHVFAEGDEVVVTEKIHGSNMRGALLNGEFYIGSHRQAKKDMENSLYWKIAREFRLEERLRAHFSDRQVILFGEIYGRRVQDLAYGLKGQSFCLFDIVIDGVYQGWDEVCRIAGELELPLVPLLKRGQFSKDDLSLANGLDTFSGSHLREGIVIKTATEQFDPTLGRKILKYLSPDYLMREQGSVARPEMQAYRTHPNHYHPGHAYHRTSRSWCGAAYLTI